MQIKMRMKYHLILINGVTIKNTREKKYWQESGEKRIFKKLKIKLLYYPTILFLSIYPKEIKIGSLRGTCTSMFITGLFTIAKIWKQPKVVSFIQDE